MGEEDTVVRPKRWPLSWWATVLLFWPALPPLVYGVAFLSWGALSVGWREYLANTMRAPIEDVARLAHVLGLIFLYIVLAFVSGLAALAFMIRLIDVLSGITGIVRIVLYDAAKAGALSEGAAAATIASKIESTLSDKIREVESRLRGEWRFAVGLIATVLLGTVALFAAIVAWLK